MTTSAQAIRNWTGPAILSYGYRPFFLLAGIWAALAMALWVPMLAGAIPAPGHFGPVDWHAHALLFGYTSAVIAGFLMTAVPNWTGRFPIVGWPLAGLVALWLAGRVAMTVPLGLSPLAVAVVDLAFPVALAAAIGREIVAGRNWRNLKVLGLFAALILANARFHWAAVEGAAVGDWGARLGLGVVILLIAVIGGRIVPSFTRNWLAKQAPGPMPAPMGTFDSFVMVLSVITLLFWVLAPFEPATGVLCLLAGGANLARLARWQGWHTGAEPLVWVLHVGFACLGLGFLAVGLNALGLMPGGTGPQHVWMAGAIGLMTLGVMTRASLGHAGLPLSAGRGVIVLYALVIGAVVTRLIAGFLPGAGWLLHLSAALWIGGFAGFAALYWPILTRPRADARRANPAPNR
ncbi:NnrS family protein [Pararhodobacter sp. SW119]|uniref:NnrS family protein n=1 Tax=Pararhodobacter sp. SW119 TaxID=2780075 RepID=UPI001ADF857A|nr:NnrS family protein [Pararhodobacter sp. SW119]